VTCSIILRSLNPSSTVTTAAGHGLKLCFDVWRGRESVPKSNQDLGDASALPLSQSPLGHIGSFRMVTAQGRHYSRRHIGQDFTSEWWQHKSGQRVLFSWYKEKYMHSSFTTLIRLPMQSLPFSSKYNLETESDYKNIVKGQYSNIHHWCWRYSHRETNGQI
jgi:hypothetical protein